jgi:glycosyltransferase involved in cell wall biosynthesis
MDKKPAISVVLPVYNAEQYIDEAIESVLAQSFADFELILIDDGSTDHSLAHLMKFAKRDSRCIVHSWKNKGIVASLNYGINQAKADIIFRMDNDDICMPQRFEKQLQYLKTHPECVAVGSEVLCIDPEGYPICKMWSLHTHEEIDNTNLTGAIGSSMCHPSVAMRKSSLLAIGGYRPEFSFAEDYDLFLRLAEVGKLANMPEVLLKYRQHFSSIGHAKRKQQLIVTQKVLEEALARRHLTLKNSLASESIEDYEPPSIQDVHIKWAWWALAEEHYQTAFRHALKALSRNPFKLNVIRLLICISRDFLLKK